MGVSLIIDHWIVQRRSDTYEQADLALKSPKKIQDVVRQGKGKNPAHIIV